MAPRWRKPNGFALVMVMIVVAVATVLGMSYLHRAAIGRARTDNLLAASEAKYVAESGTQHALWVLQTEKTIATPNGGFGPYEISGGGGEYHFWITPTGTAGVFDVMGQCQSGGVKQRSTIQASRWNEHHKLLLGYGPYSYWRLGESSASNAADQMGRHTGTYRGGFSAGTAVGQDGALVGDDDKAPRFDGFNDRVDLGEIDIGGGKLTILAWIWCPPAWQRTTDYGRIVSRADGNGSSNCLWELAVSNWGSPLHLRFRVQTEENVQTLHATKPLPQEQWVLAVGVYDDGADRMWLYQNGEEVGSCWQNRPIKRHDGLVAWIGGLPPLATERPWTGFLDEVAIFKKALTQEQIKALADARMAELEVLDWRE